MKKICYVVTIPLTIEAFFIPQLQYLADNGLDVTAVCSASDTLQEQLGEKVRYVPMDIPRGISLGGSIKAIRMLTEFLKKEQFDMVQYSTPNAALYASIAAKKAGIQIRNYHLMGFRYLGARGIGQMILKCLEKSACRNSTHIECVSDSNLEIGVENGIFPAEKAIVVWNGSSGGIDLQRFDGSKRESYRREVHNQYGISENEFVFGFVGRITRDKGVNEILEAFSKLREIQQESECKLMLVGSPEGIDTLDQQLYQKSLHNVDIIYVGSVDDVEKYYAAIDVLLLPSYREGFGNVIIEAAAMGTPAIVSKIPGPVDAVIENETALLIEPGNAESLKQAMEQMTMDKARVMGNKAREYVESHFDSRVLCESILERKRELLRS